MTTTLGWSKQAQQDLLAIGRYIAQDDRAAARRWVERLRQRARQAAEHPLAGRVVPEYGLADVREVLVRTYRIVCLLRGEGIEVLTVFEGHRLFPEGTIPDRPTEES